MEFGSDFHICTYPKCDNSIFISDKNLYASGRQALKHLILSNKWTRIWVPTYFCGESLECIRHIIDICYYSMVPGQNFEECIPFDKISPNDVLFIVNYFGMYRFQEASKYNCTVIEDHTHDLIGNWARKSTADWCIASLRKTLPIADGGVLWSPNHNQLPSQPTLTTDTLQNMAARYAAMQLKTDYLVNMTIDKQEFLDIFHATEESFSALEVSDCSATTRQILSEIDVQKWYDLKHQNAKMLLSLLHFNVASPLIFDITGITPFSFVILYDNQEQRDKAKRYLINNNVYPAILWPDVVASDRASIDFANRMLSIHCDGRYTQMDMTHLASIINKII